MHNDCTTTRWNGSFWLEAMADKQLGITSTQSTCQVIYTLGDLSLVLSSSKWHTRWQDCFWLRVCMQSIRPKNSNLKILISAHARVKMSQNAMLVARKPSCRDASAFLTRLKLIWPRSSLKPPKCLRIAFFAKSSGSQWVNRARMQKTYKNSLW